jgi:hypothetical protein
LTGGEGYSVLLTGTFLVTVTLLLAPPAANIAILVYARTVTRQQEFAARVALGATRGRIVGQLLWMCSGSHGHVEYRIRRKSLEANRKLL